MASIQATNSAGNSPKFRTRGRSLLLLGVLMINLLLVAVAPTMRPDPATAQDSKPAVAQQADRTKEPQPDQAADATTEAAPAVDHIASDATAAAEQDDRQNGTLENPPRVTEVESSRATSRDLAKTETEAANSDPANMVANELESEAVAQAEVNPPEKSREDASAEVMPETTQPAPVAAPNLLIVNPADAGGTVIYLVDGEAHSLAPGESHDLAERRDYTIEFHRGGEFGEAELVLRSGTYHFRVGDTGWNLAAASSSHSER